MIPPHPDLPRSRQLPGAPSPRALLVLACVLGLVAGCAELDEVNVADAIRAGGELRIGTLAGNNTFYRDQDGYTGFEHDLTLAFANWLGVEPRFVVAPNYTALREMLETNRVHVGAALLPVKREQWDTLRYGPTYTVARQLVAHRRGQPPPRSVEELKGWQGATIAGRGAQALMARELPVADGYTWTVQRGLSIDDLLAQVDSGEIDYAVVPSFEFEAARRAFPEIRVALELGVPQPIAWLSRNGADDSLWRAQLGFFREMRKRGELAEIFDRYFGHIEAFDYVEFRAFVRDYHKRLPDYLDWFKEAAAEHDLDWRLLAAVGYQESHWREDARSPTGVRGIMMLTSRTAAALGVDRMVPAEAIRGGAMYLTRMKQRLPDRITEPDLTWFALAAYNIGLGHLEDARVFADQAGKNPDLWTDVREFLPMLGSKKWARKARHGSARGYQAVHFVRNVRQYFDVLRRLEAERTKSPGGPQRAPGHYAELVSPVF